MAELWENEEFQHKLRKLPPHLQESFLHHLEGMYDEESNEMLTFIEESRAAMRDTASEMKHEQDALKQTSDILASGRSSRAYSDSGSVNNYLTHKYRATATPANFDYEVENKLAVERYMRKREKGTKKKKSKDKDGTAVGGRDGSPDSQDSYAEDAQEILQDMQRTTSRMETERERQAELVRKMKEQKKKKKLETEAMAAEIMGQADDLENAQKREKEKQEQKLMEKLEEKKRKKKKKDKDRDPEAGEEGAEGEDGEDGKEKKKKKKKDKDKDNEENAEGGEDGEKKKKKKKKEKEKDEEGEDGDKKEKKKKKKKDKDKEAEEV